LSVLAWQIKVDLSSIFFIPWWGIFEGSFGVDPLRWNAGMLKVVKGLLEESLLDHMSVLHMPGGFGHGIDDALEYCGVHVISPRDISCQSRG